MVSRKPSAAKECRLQIYPGFGLAILTATIRGAEAGGGGAFPGGSMRICPSGQTQPQADPKQQPQTPQSMQGGMPGGINFSPQSRAANQFYRPSQPRVPTRSMMPQTLQPSNISYQTQTTIIPQPYITQPLAAGVLLPYAAAPIAPSGRHQSHGGGQAGGTTAAAQANYYPTQQQIYMTTPSLTPYTPHSYPTHATPQYVYPHVRANSFPTPNSGPHQGVPPQPPPQQPPQQFVVDPVASAGGGGPASGSGTGVMITHGHPPGPPQPPQQQKRRPNALTIIDPNSGRDVIQDYLNEKSQSHSGESSTSVTPHPAQTNGYQVAADFAARVAAVATDEELPPSVGSSVTVAVNGPPSTPPQQQPPPTPPSTAVEINPPPNVVPLIPSQQVQPPALQQPPQPQLQSQIQPPPPQPLPQPQQIPTVSAITDSPSVELPRPKIPSAAVSPGRKPTPIPQNVQPIVEVTKKKEKKVVVVTGALPPHKEEPEEIKKSAFAEAFNLKNITPPISVQSQIIQPPPVTPVNAEPETNGETDAAVTQPLVAPTPAPPQPQPAKHHEKHEKQDKHEKQKQQHDDQPTHQHERGKQAQSKKSKKKSNVKELNRKGQEKEGGSDMDAFTSLPPTPAATATPAAIEVKAPSPPPLAPKAVVQQTEIVVPAQQEVKPAEQPPVIQQQHPSAPTSTIVAPVNLNKTVDNEQDEGMVVDMEDEEEHAQDVLMVAAKNEENNKVSAAAQEQTLNNSDERIVIQTTVIERSNPPALKYTYKEDQWSPLNPEGKKVYDRDFLLGLRTEALSIKRPDIEDCDIIKTDSSNNNNSVSANNNNRRLHGSSSMGMNRDERGFTPIFMRNSASQRGGMIGKRGSQQGRPGGGGGRSGKMMYSNSQYKPDLDEDLHWATKGGWKPERCKSPPKLSEDEVKTENLYKKVRGILNKLTPQKFDTLLEQIARLPIDTQDRLKGVVELVFDKAVDEPSFSIAYAKLCQNLGKISVRIAKEDAEGNEGTQQMEALAFRKVLLTRCQQMFEKKRKEETGEDGKKSDDERIAELQQAIAAEENKDKKKELQLILEEEERKIRVKYVGLARFIGELFKLQMLTSSIMHGCIKTLLEKIEEESLECLCKLLTTVGKELESQSSNTKELDEYFAKMKKLSQKSSNQKVSSRVRFMLQDVIELRSNRWVPRRDENNPKTMEQIQRDAERETFLESALLSSNTPRSKHSDRDDRRRGPRSGANSQDAEGWSTATKSSFRSYAFEPSKLQHIKGIDNENNSLGSHSQFSQWNVGSNAKRGGGGDPQTKFVQNKFALLSQEEKKISTMMTRKVTPSSSQEKERAVQGVRDAFIRDDRSNKGQSSNPPSRDSSRVRGKTPSTTQVPVVEQERTPSTVKPPMDPDTAKVKSKVVFEEWLANHNVQESVDCIQETFPDAMQFVQPVMESVLDGKPISRAMFGELLAALLSRNIVTAADFTKDLLNLIELGEELMIDLPLFWSYIAEFLVPIIAKGVYTFADLKAACESCKTPHLTKTLAEIFKQLTKEKGPVFIKQQWEASRVQFTDFFPESEVENFIKTNKCGFLIGEGEVEAGESLPMDQVEEKLLNFLRSENNDKIFDHICEWIKANVGNRTQDNDFIKALTRAVFKANIKNEQHLNSASLVKHEKLIKRFVDANESRELACLHGIQNLVVVQLMAPQGLLLEIFQYLYENNIISNEAFVKWKTCDGTQYEAEGKGVAVASLAPFFVSLAEQDTEDTDDDSS